MAPLEIIVFSADGFRGLRRRRRYSLFCASLRLPFLERETSMGPVRHEEHVFLVHRVIAFGHAIVFKNRPRTAMVTYASCSSSFFGSGCPIRNRAEYLAPILSKHVITVHCFTGQISDVVGNLYDTTTRPIRLFVCASIFLGRSRGDHWSIVVCWIVVWRAAAKHDLLFGPICARMLARW